MIILVHCSAQIPAVREPKNLYRDNGKRPDGLTMIPWSKGRSLVWDFTVSDTLSSSHVHQTSQEVAKSAIKAEEKKLSHYKQLATSGFIVM